MRTQFTAALVFTPYLATASPVTISENINAIWQNDKMSNMTAVTVLSPDWSEVYGVACGNALNFGPFVDFSISFDVDQKGHGHIDITGQKYLLHSKPEMPGGITYGRV